MHFKFSVLLISYFCIANHVLGTPPNLVPPEPTEEELINGVYAHLTNLPGKNPDQPTSDLTLDQFFSFVGSAHSHIDLINGYFTMYPLDWMNYQLTENIDDLLFRRLIRTICIGTGRNPIQFTILSVAKFEGKQPSQGLEIIRGAMALEEKRKQIKQENLAIINVYELARKYFKLPSESNLTFDHLLFVLSATNKEIIVEYFNKYKDEAPYQNNIPPVIFDEIVRTVCEKNGTNVLDFMTAISNSMRYINNDY